MPQYTFIFGNHPVLSLAELCRVFAVGPGEVVSLYPTAVTLKLSLTKNEVLAHLPGLGGTTKICTPLPSVPDQDKENLVHVIVSWLQTIDNTGKLSVGFNYLGPHPLDLNEIAHLAKALVKLRYVLPVGGVHLSAAQITHNQLDNEKGFDLNIIETPTGYALCSTLAVQNVDFYHDRDEGRPLRPSDEGMMPLKLCQILLNLALHGKNPITVSAPLVLDPFCGSGTILQEAMLMGYQTVGSDISKDAINTAQANLIWFAKKFQKWIPLQANYALLTQPAQKIHQALGMEAVSAIVSEGFLGELFLRPPALEQIHHQNQQLIKLYHEVFVALRKVLRPEALIVMSLPYYLQSKVSLLELILDDIKQIGYNLESWFEEDLSARLSVLAIQQPTAYGSYIYSRPRQIIGREIIILSKT